METAMFDVGDYVKINAVALKEGVDASAYKIDALISINGNVYYRLKGINNIYRGEELTRVLSTDAYSYEEKPKESDDTDKVMPLYAEKANGCKCAEAKDQSCDIKLANKAEKDIAKACNQLMVTLIKKNRDYGDSFGNTFRELGPITGLTRFLDKVNRIKNLTKEAGKHEVTDESLLDTWKDAAGYAILNYINLLPSKEVTDKNSQTTKDNK
jgi:hypothetical protein